MLNLFKLNVEQIWKSFFNIDVILRENKRKPLTGDMEFEILDYKERKGLDEYGFSIIKSDDVKLWYCNEVRVQNIRFITHSTPSSEHISRDANLLIPLVNIYKRIYWAAFLIILTIIFSHIVF